MSLALIHTSTAVSKGSLQGGEGVRLVSLQTSYSDRRCPAFWFRKLAWVWHAPVLWNTGRAHRGADLAVLRGHAISVMQVCKGLGCSPGLQVPGHADGSPHLGSIEGVARSEEVRTPSFPLGVRNRALHVAYRRGKTSPSCPLAPTKRFLPHHSLTPRGFCPHSFSVTGSQCYKLLELSDFFSPNSKR